MALMICILINTLCAFRVIRDKIYLNIFKKSYKILEQQKGCHRINLQLN